MIPLSVSSLKIGVKIKKLNSSAFQKAKREKTAFHLWDFNVQSLKLKKKKKRVVFHFFIFLQQSERPDITQPSVIYLHHSDKMRTVQLDA